MSLLETSLTSQIHHFIKTFLIVKEDQVYRFFRSYGVNGISSSIKLLLNDKQIFYYQDGYLCSDRPKYIKKPFLHFESIIQAVNVLCMWDATNITHIQRGDFGQDILFIVDAKDFYCVTYFDEQNFGAKWNIGIQYRKRYLIDKENDITTYIALFPKESISMSSRLGALKFHYICSVDQNGNCETFIQK